MVYAVRRSVSINYIKETVLNYTWNLYSFMCVNKGKMLKKFVDVGIFVRELSVPKMR